MDAQITSGIRSGSLAFAGMTFAFVFRSLVLPRYHCGMNPQPIRSSLRILGIDPGLRRTGWGVIEIDGNRLIFVGCGSVEPPDSLPLASRLLAIHEGLAAVLGDFRPRKPRSNRPLSTRTVSPR